MANQTDPTQVITSPTRFRARPSRAKQGIANKYWLELVPYPTGSARSLWLHIEGDGWKRLDNPNDSIEWTVQQAFNDLTNSHHQVLVFYQEETIVGLVVRSKEAS